MKSKHILMMGAFAATCAFGQSSNGDKHAREVFAHHAGHLMSPQQLQALPSLPADYRISYGADENQFGDLRVPPGPGPHPLAILIHGGCWKADFATLRDLAPMADALKAEGIATWNIEYRRLSQPGSGWPGTYLDVGKGVDYVRTIATEKNLDLRNVIVLGHSAGGHLAMWVAARSRLPLSSPIYVKDPLLIRGVIDLAGTGDMEAYIQVEQQACGAAVVEEMLGGKPVDVPQHYIQVSAIRLLPLGIPQVLIWGRQDDYVPIGIGEKYIQAAKQAGDHARLVSFPDAGHFEIVSPLSATWPAVENEILSLLAKRHD
jgi:acetyl esterase/lipase